MTEVASDPAFTAYCPECGINHVPICKSCYQDTRTEEGEVGVDGDE